jgi:hypothetical protein
MKTKPPSDRRKFADGRDEMEYLYHKLLYWLYERAELARAGRYAERLARLLTKAVVGHETIFPEECWSLICEARGDSASAIRHRRKEIQLIKSLHAISQTGPQRDAIFRLYGYDDLSERLDLLAVLYHDSGQRDRAIEALQESKRLCQQHGVRFEGEELLREYLSETNEAKGRKRVSATCSEEKD